MSDERRANMRELTPGSPEWVDAADAMAKWVIETAPEADDELSQEEVIVLTTMAGVIRTLVEQVRAAQDELTHLRAREGATFPAGAGPCDRPPTGWYCTREKGHEGPCAAWRQR